MKNYFLSHDFRKRHNNIITFIIIVTIRTFFNEFSSPGQLVRKDKEGKTDLLLVNVTPEISAGSEQTIRTEFLTIAN